MGPSTLESDDEEENPGDSSSLFDGEIDPARARCGGRALSSAFTTAENDRESKDEGLMPALSKGRAIWLGLRHCYFDHAAADALADMKVASTDKFGVEMELDVHLNNVLEEEMTRALHGKDDEHLREMAESHIEKMSVIRQAEERAREAAKTAAGRARAEAAFSATWNAPDGLSDEESEEDVWDSDADYENEDDMSY